MHNPTERGIMFSGPMVAALLAGTKTQTRRALPGPPDDAILAAVRRRFRVPGDRLWGRERYVAFGRWEVRFNERKGREEWFFTDLTRATGRILLEVTDVRIERLQNISPADAIAEGILRIGEGFELEGGGTTTDPVLAYRGVWERINGAGSWDADLGSGGGVSAARLLERPR